MLQILSTYLNILFKYPKNLKTTLQFEQINDDLIFTIICKQGKIKVIREK